MNKPEPEFTVSEPENKPLANGDETAMDALIERCKTEKGAAFEAEVLADLGTPV